MGHLIEISPGRSVNVDDGIYFNQQKASETAQAISSLQDIGEELSKRLDKGKYPDLYATIQLTLDSLRNLDRTMPVQAGYYDTNSSPFAFNLAEQLYDIADQTLTEISEKMNELDI